MVKRFKSKASYRKWLAYGHIHDVFNPKSREQIRIHGRVHRVKHT